MYRVAIGQDSRLRKRKQETCTWRVIEGYPLEETVMRMWCSMPDARFRYKLFNILGKVM